MEGERGGDGNGIIGAAKTPVPFVAHVKYRIKHNSIPPVTSGIGSKEDT